MDADQLYMDIMQLKCQNTECVYFPIYDRGIHDPVANAIEIEPDVQIVILEGLYLIHWQRVRNALDYHVYLEVDTRAMRDRLKHRKLQTGGTVDGIEAHFERVDSKTMEIAARGRNIADTVIRSGRSINPIPGKSNAVAVTYEQVLRYQSKL